MQSMQQKFDKHIFNFTKMDKREILFEILNKNRQHKGNYLAINVSPLELGHCLLLPAMYSCLPQVVTADGLLAAIELFLLTKSPPCFIMNVNDENIANWLLQEEEIESFVSTENHSDTDAESEHSEHNTNSEQSDTHPDEHISTAPNPPLIQGLPSTSKNNTGLPSTSRNTAKDEEVDNKIWQGINEVESENITHSFDFNEIPGPSRHVPNEVEHLAGPCYVLLSFPSQGFVFQLSKHTDIQEFVGNVFKLVSFLQDNEKPHNIFITRGSSFQEKSPNSVRDHVRVYIWARKPACEAKEDAMFYPALCEMFGQLLFRKRDDYETVTEEVIANIMTDLTKEPFQSVVDQVRRMFQNP
ncbi:GDP-D-glucose phosphorylase 1 [Homalodisca vitripennis]|nr:GDP-D-glucose phosphorylase 1 [Homalodisca vitripennis]